MAQRRDRLYEFDCESGGANVKVEMEAGQYAGKGERVGACLSYWLAMPLEQFVVFTCALSAT